MPMTVRSSSRSCSLSLALALGIGLGLAAMGARAAEPQPTNVVSFSSSVTMEVVKDWLTIRLSATRDGADAATVQSQLKQALDSALKEAKRSAEPGAMEVSTGGFNVWPRYGANSRITGWQGSAELVLAGQDGPRVAATAGRLTSMAISGTGYSFSREMRQKVDADLTAQAIQKFRTRASEISQQFGFTGYALREVSVQGSEQESAPVPMFALRAAAKSADTEALPTEPGKGTLSATVQGSVVLTR